MTHFHLISYKRDFDERPLAHIATSKAAAERKEIALRATGHEIICTSIIPWDEHMGDTHHYSKANMASFGNRIAEIIRNHEAYTKP